MEEVDSIILETLKSLNCDLPEDISSLKQFDEDIVILCVSTCLESIIPTSKFPKKLSPSMAMRIKTASRLAEQIKDIGYRDEIGYQTILYFNETEIRRLFIFLIESLPKETGSITQAEEVGYVPKLLRSLRKQLRASSIWIPPSLHNKGTFLHDDSLEIRSYGNSCPLDIKNVKIPSSEHQTSEGVRDYHVSILPTVTKQCSPRQLIPSLLFEDCKFSRKNRNLLSYLKSIPQAGTTAEIRSTVEKETETGNLKVETGEKAQDIAINVVTNIDDNSIETLLKEFEIKRKEYAELQESIASEEEILSKLIEEKEREEKRTEELKTKIKIKKMAKEIVNDEEKVQKLKDINAKSNSKLEKMKQQWNQIKESLVKKHDQLQITISEKEARLHEKKESLREIMQTYEDMAMELKNKIRFEKKVIEKHKDSPQNVNRSMYTNNIIEIIGNIKKQNLEIQKILKDTKVVQKDINSLNGQIDRSFTLCDEMIFLHAKEDESSKKAYKLLVSIHNECGEIVKLVSDIGFVERECRNIQEQIDIEGAKQIATKLKRATEDYQKIKEENTKIENSLLKSSSIPKTD